MLIKKVIVFFLLLCSVCSYAEDYRLWNRNYDTAPVDKIVLLALEQTEDLYGESLLIRSSAMEQGEAFDNLEHQDGLDLLSAAASTELEQRFLVVRFPLLKGLLGHRVCFIRSGDQSRFDNIRTSYDFRANNIKICQGDAWPDTKVLQRNGALLATSPIYSKLFDLLHSGECGCFLRGAQEIISEYETHKHKLDMEQRIAVQYMQPGLLYVSKNNPELAARIELGLLRALDNGSYEKVFQDLLGTSIKQLNLDKRHYISLDNPYQPASLDSIKSNQSLWFEP